ncbi:hypothetical protein ABKP09_19930 [Peribacillus frigoritolerans]|uniref:hypothetical protein n=1 Tax=Peribacillus frigoritolerans TaxID=450367 RepID=UPI0032B4270C
MARGNLKTSILEEREGIVGKVCTKCNEWGALDCFYVMKRGLGGRKSVCKKCCQIKDAEYRTKNKEYYRTKTKEFEAKNKELRSEINRRWREKNKSSEAYKSYKTVQRQRRHARKALLPDSLTHHEKALIYDYFNNSCALTGSLEGKHLDHVIPLAVGHGGTVYGNMAPLRFDLNFSKSDQNIFEWFEANSQRFQLSQKRFDDLINYLAAINNMTIEEYRTYVYWCHANPREYDL